MPSTPVENVRTRSQAKPVSIDDLFSLMTTFQADYKTTEASSKVKLDSLLTKVNNIQNDLDNRITLVEEKAEKIEKQVADLSIAVANYDCDRDREKRLKELMLSGVPFVQSESLPAIFAKIATKFGYSDAKPAPVVDLRRLHSKNGAGQILINFIFLSNKIEFFKNYMANKDLSTYDLGFTSNTRIYINENLTKKNAEIKKAALILKKNGKIHQVFTSSGIVLIRREADVTAVHISSLDDLEQFSK